MIAGKKVLAIIPARGGSKGVPRKNIRQAAGKPLIAWTIQEAQKSGYIDRIIVSTEDPEIAEIAREWGAEIPFMRPAELARDETPGIEPVIHAIRTLPGYAYVVLLQPTSPLRCQCDIDGCIELCRNRMADSCVSVCEPEKSPYWMFTVDGEGRMQRLLDSGSITARRQDLPAVYALNGAVYVADTEALLRSESLIMENTVPYLMSKTSSIDIDTETDLAIATFLLEKQLSMKVESVSSKSAPSRQ